MIQQLIVAIGICLTAGALGGVVTAKAIPTWYRGLRKPSFNPPNWVFGPVWSLLYILMGVALFLIWRQTGEWMGPASIMFYIQLTLNVAWSYVFFGLKAPRAAFLEVVLLWLAIAATIWLFYPISALAAWLLIPYLAWVSFAALLTGAIARLNERGTGLPPVL